MVVDVPAELEPAASAFWAEVLGWPLGAGWRGHPELASFEPADGDAYVHRQVVDAPPRFHLDLEVDDVDAATARLVSLGAAVGHRAEDWQSLVSPGGLPFCVCRAGTGRALPSAVSRPGHRLRLVQVCVDLPRDQVDSELTFWRTALTGGRWGTSDAPEFLAKFHDDAGSPLQLLFQRLDEESGPVRAHLDLGTDDVVAAAERIRGLGATHLRDGAGFVAFRDPVGTDFCVTGNSPEATVRRDLGPVR